jgi:hypothetical protein
MSRCVPPHYAGQPRPQLPPSCDPQRRQSGRPVRHLTLASPNRPSVPSRQSVGWARCVLIAVLVWQSLSPLAAFSSPASDDKRSLDPLATDVSRYWSGQAIPTALPPVSSDRYLDEAVHSGDDSWSAAGLLEESGLASSFLSDDATSYVEPVQMLTPGGAAPGGLQFSANGAARGDTLASTGRRARVARTPYMIGDTIAGTCTTFAGLLLEAELSHPTLACSRLNIAEANTAIPVDRLYFSYRHFNNATRLRAFQFQEVHNLDRFTLGGEHTFLDGLCSVEMRIPIDGRVSSELATVNTFNIDGRLIPFEGTRRAELANLSAIFKMLLWNRSDWAVSGGLGITLPTAEDVHYTALTQDTIFFPNFPNPGDVTTTERNTFVDVQAANETFYLAPFMAWLWTPESHPRFFHQGFLQVEVAANPSAVKISGDGFNTANIPGFPPTNLLTVIPAAFSRADLNPQTLMRLNLGMGYHLHDNPSATWLQRLTALAELHYTTTLEDAKTSTVTAFDFFTEFGNGFDTFITEDIFIGNRANRSDLLNLAVGLSGNVGNWVVTNGMAVPLRDAANRGFAFEYNLQLQRPF